MDVHTPQYCIEEKVNTADDADLSQVFIHDSLGYDLPLSSRP